MKFELGDPKDFISAIEGVSKENLSLMFIQTLGYMKSLADENKELQRGRRALGAMLISKDMDKDDSPTYAYTDIMDRVSAVSILVNDCEESGISSFLLEDYTLDTRRSIKEEKLKSKKEETDIMKSLGLDKEKTNIADLVRAMNDSLESTTKDLVDKLDQELKNKIEH